MEFGTDTTRTIASLIFSGTSAKYKDINWIWSHGGGSVTAFAERFLVQMVNTPPYRGKFTQQYVMFFYIYWCRLRIADAETPSRRRHE